MNPLDIHALADGELSPENASGVKQLVAENDHAAAEFREVQSLKRALSTRLPAVDVTKEWQGCLGRLDAMDRTRRAEGFVTRYAWALCGIFFVLIMGGGLLRRANPDKVRTSEVARMMSSLSPISKPAPGDMHRWLDWTLGPVKNTMQMDRLQIVGASEALIDGRRVVCLNLTDRRGAIALLVIPKAQGVDDGDGTPDREFRPGMIGQMNSVSWTQDGYAMVLMAERSTEELQAMATNIAAH